MDWIDITVTLKNGLASWPGDPELNIKRAFDMDKGDAANLTRMDMSAHTGTHMDAPLHFIKNGQGIDTLPLRAVIGEARVIEIEDTESIKPSELDRHSITKGERILFKTANSKNDWTNAPFQERFVHISTEAGHHLVDCGIQTVGIDYLSVAGYNKNEAELHRILLDAGIWIIEGLDLSNVKAGRYELICLPMKIENGDGAPARALIRPR